MKIFKRIGIIIFLVILLLVILHIADSYMWPKPNIYDDSYFSWEGGRVVYSGPNGENAMFGIDVSSHNGYIDWKKLKKQGVDFAFIRVGYRGYTKRKINQDKMFHYNIKEAQKARIKVGVYFFSQSININEAKEEAQFTIKNISSYNISMPVVYDMEEMPQDPARVDSLTDSQRTDCALTFINTVEFNGYETMIYGNKKWLSYKFEPERIGKKNLWLASYNDRPGYPYRFKAWQYTEKGRLKGIKGNVDFNIWLPD